MQMFRIEEVKEFMELLFLKDFFDSFDVAAMEVKTLVPISLNGSLQKDWLGEEEREMYQEKEYVPWKLLRPMAFSLIRGTQTPSMMKIQFVHYFPNGDCGGFRIQYENKGLFCVSSYTAAQFTLDKSTECIWDEKCVKFLKKSGLLALNVDEC